MNTTTLNGTYGSHLTPCEVIVATDHRGASWYVVSGSVNVNRTYDELSDGVDVEILNDFDTATAKEPITTEEELLEFLED
jgi:hypothetical protein